VAKLLEWLARDWSLVESYLVRELMHISWVRVVKITALVVEAHSILLLNSLDELSLRVLFVQELRQGVVS
jgi:hypothetical protein